MKQAIECMLNPPIKGDFIESFESGWQAQRRAGLERLVSFNGQPMIIQRAGRKFRVAVGLLHKDYKLARKTLDVLNVIGGEM